MAKTAIKTAMVGTIEEGKLYTIGSDVINLMAITLLQIAPWQIIATD